LFAKEHHLIMNVTMTISDAIYLLFVAICFWLAFNIDDAGGGGGKRARVPTAC
jgi:hypothetical protein